MPVKIVRNCPLYLLVLVIAHVRIWSYIRITPGYFEVMANDEITGLAIEPIGFDGCVGIIAIRSPIKIFTLSEKAPPPESSINTPLIDSNLLRCFKKIRIFRQPKKVVIVGFKGGGSSRSGCLQGIIEIGGPK